MDDNLGTTLNKISTLIYIGSVLSVPAIFVQLSKFISLSFTVFY